MEERKRGRGNKGDEERKGTGREKDGGLGKVGGKGILTLYLPAGPPLPGGTPIG